MATKQSKEVKIQREVEKWLTSYDMEFVTQNESVNPEIDKALSKAPSKTGGEGANLVDVKLLLKDSKLDYYPIMIELKWGSNKLEKLDKEDHVANTKTSGKEKGEPNYTNINGYAVNGAVHYANAILQYSSYTDVIAIGITGDEDEAGNLETRFGVYYVSKSNYGIGQKVGEYSDLSFLKPENFDEFTEKVKELQLSEAELRLIHQKREDRIEDALTKINESLFNKQKNISALARIHLVAASIMANLGVAGKVKPLEPADLKSSDEEGDTDGDILIRKIKAFLKEKNLPLAKQEQILRHLEPTILESSFSYPRNGVSLLKEIFTEVIDDLGYFYKIGVDTDFTGKLFNVMFRWLSFAGDDQNDVVLTPRYVALLMAKLARVNKDSYVWDFATGSGGLLVAAMNLMLDDAKKEITSPDELREKEEKIKAEQILGIEILPEIYMLAVLNMILMGDGSSNILQDDSLKKFDGKYGYGKENERFPADVFLLNPPYSETGNGMNFVKRALSMMKGGYASIIIQDSAGAGKAKEINQKILEHNTLLASIKMPMDIFIGKSSVQTSIYVFKVGDKHEAKQRVKFIDLRNDGYKRSGRKTSNASKNLQDINNAVERYEEVVNLVKFGKDELNIFTEKEYIEDVIALSGENYGEDWNFEHHITVNDSPVFRDFIKTVSNHMSWETGQVIKENDVIDSEKMFVKLSQIELTSKEKQVIANFDSIRWKAFKLGNLFEKSKTTKLPYKAKNLPKEPREEYILPALTSSFMNQGLNYYVPESGATVLRDVISIPSNSDVYRAYFQSRNFTVLSDSYAIHWKNDEEFDSKCYLFMVTCINKVTDLPIYSYKNKLGGWNVVKEKEIQLPVDENDEIDFSYMETFIQATKKRYLKSLVFYVNNNL